MERLFKKCNEGKYSVIPIDTVSKALSRYFKLCFFDSDRDTRKIILCRK